MGGAWHGEGVTLDCPRARILGSDVGLVTAVRITALLRKTEPPGAERTWSRKCGDVTRNDFAKSAMAVKVFV